MIYVSVNHSHSHHITRTVGTDTKHICDNFMVGIVCRWMKNPTQPVSSNNNITHTT